METTRKFNQDLGSSSLSVRMIEKVHRCADCPIRKLAIKHTNSVFAKLHTWHKSWWPAWKAHEARTCAYAATTGAHA
jgi:hypothetical protein